MSGRNLRGGRGTFGLEAPTPAQIIHVVSSRGGAKATSSRDPEERAPQPTRSPAAGSLGKRRRAAAGTGRERPREPRPGRDRGERAQGSPGAEKGAWLSPLSHASKKSFSFRVFSSFTSRTSFSAITSFGDEEEDGEEGREEEETPERSVLGYRAAIIAAHEGGRPGDGGGAPIGPDPDPSAAPGLEKG